MKKVFLLLLSVMIFSGFASINTFMMQSDQIAKEVSEAIAKGNARDVARHFGNNVDLNIPGHEGTFSRNQAELILRNFFSRNAPERFTQGHQGSSRDGSLFVIGNLITSQGQTFRTFFLIKKVGDQMVLHQLQFEQQ